MLKKWSDIWGELENQKIKVVEVMEETIEGNQSEWGIREEDAKTQISCAVYAQLISAFGLLR